MFVGFCVCLWFTEFEFIKKAINEIKMIMKQFDKIHYEVSGSNPY